MVEPIENEEPVEDPAQEDKNEENVTETPDVDNKEVHEQSIFNQIYETPTYFAFMFFMLGTMAHSIWPFLNWHVINAWIGLVATSLIVCVMSAALGMFIMSQVPLVGHIMNLINLKCSMSYTIMYTPIELMKTLREDIMQGYIQVGDKWLTINSESTLVLEE